MLNQQLIFHHEFRRGGSETAMFSFVPALEIVKNSYNGSSTRAENFKNINVFNYLG
jgi:hypothetical protein